MIEERSERLTWGPFCSSLGCHVSVINHWSVVPATRAMFVLTMYKGEMVTNSTMVSLAQYTEATMRSTKVWLIGRPEGECRMVPMHDRGRICKRCFTDTSSIGTIPDDIGHDAARASCWLIREDEPRWSMRAWISREGDAHICSGTELMGVVLAVFTKSSTIRAATYVLVNKPKLISVARRTAFHVIVQSLKEEESWQL